MKIGIIGGSGLYDMPGIEGRQERQVRTPFGAPSAPLVCGRLEGVEVAFLARHGRGHVLLPSEVNYRANIYALKKIGVSRIISIAAVGSFREELAPRDIVFVDQFVDRTHRNEQQTFFGQGVAAHISFADPVCPALRQRLFEVAREVLAAEASTRIGRPPIAHPGGTYLNMEGPAFSTRAESFLYKSWGMDVIGMTNLSEARLAREAELCYCTMAMVTDYDSWHAGHENVSVEMVVNTLRENTRTAQEIIRRALPRLQDAWECSCSSALENAVITRPEAIAPEARERLSLFLAKYLD